MKAYGNCDLLLSVLRRAPAPMTAEELRTAIGGDPADILATIEECHRAGLIRAARSRANAYTPTGSTSVTRVRL